MGTREVSRRRFSSLTILLPMALSLGVQGCGDESSSSVGSPAGPVNFGENPGADGSNTSVLGPTPTNAAMPMQPAPPIAAPPPPMQDVPVPPPPTPQPNPTPNPPADMNPPPTQPMAFDGIRFVALGDAGKDNDGQVRVAEAIAGACEALQGCDFAVLLGDNIYDAGAVSAQDPVWITHFEEPYAGVDLPFYATLGNHDYGAPSFLDGLGGGIGIERARGQAQVAYAATQDKFRMPAEYYHFVNGPVELVSLDTATMFWRDLDWAESAFDYVEVNQGQEAALAQWAGQSQTPWRIAFGHHPYLSNGRHGNAGRYDGVPEGLIGSGTSLKTFFEAYILGRFHVYLAGHDHLLQDLGEVDGTQLIVSGAGASSTELEFRNEYEWQSESLGFVMVEANATTLTLRFFEVADQDGAMMPWVESHTRSITRMP